MIRILAALFFVAVFVAKESSYASREPVVPSKTLLTVVSGEQETTFELDGRRLKFANSTQRREVLLTRKDFREVNQQLKPIMSSNPHEKRFCGRAYLEVDSLTGRKTFCLNSKTTSGKASGELARLLALIVKIR